MRVAVAGGSGFLGRHVVDALRERGHEARVLARRVDASMDRQGVEHRMLDAGAGPWPAEVLRGCEAVVNLVGIKAPRGSNDFGRAHVGAVEHMIEACRAAGIERVVHVSVAQADDAVGGYAETKRQGERLVEDSGLQATVLRPGLIYGPGDDALRNLVRMVRLAPLVPVPRGATGPLPAVDVRDVATAVVEALERPRTVGATIDVVGPEVLELRGLVRRVAKALELPTLTPSLPDPLARLGAAVMERMLPDPLLSRSQLAMLTRGLPGDPSQAEAALGLRPRALSEERIREIAAGVPDLLPSVRLVTSREHRAWLRERAAAMRGWPVMLLLALAVMLGLPYVLPSVWTRMAVIEVGLSLMLVLSMRRAWAPLLRPSAAAIGLGLGLAAVFYGGAAAFMAGLRQWAPAFAAQVQEVYAWIDLAPLPVRLSLLPLIVLGEDFVWRGAFTIPLAVRLGPVLGCLAAGTVFALAHLSTGPPLLALAAVIMGTLWSMLAVRTRSLVPVMTCHLAWDLMVMFVRPL
ncbi:NAD-dependent epimerase/dehydratase family protein [Paraliomyxa miuraensis]|uniref:NAD-dependent epimerase/dehydratase family protein n=1 Tax=Paraliomyxa miuraensis TaxID=376150 RepID=UPI0022582FE7|nr:NAD-dependent epimerase/dehydratase family protein [Paraliomyxa miuraensis]MCX4242937.1 NAD(P)H-binding protein [Paraliomyxa miuraensis]